MLRLQSQGHHLDIARGRSLLIFTALLDFFLLHTFLHFLFLLRTFRSLWSLGCPLTALRFLGTSTGKAVVIFFFRMEYKTLSDQFKLNLLGLSLFFFLLFGSSWFLLLSLHQPQESQKQEYLGENGQHNCLY